MASSNNNSSSNSNNSSAGRKINSVTRDDIFHLFHDAKSKDDVIHVLTKHQQLIKKIPMPCPSVTIEQAKKDFRRERVLLNDVPYIPDQLDVSRSNGFAKSLSMLIDRIKNRGHINCTEQEDVADLIMKRSCRTSAGADAFFTVQRLLCVDGTFVTQKTSGHDPPIRIDVFISSNCEDLFHQAEGSSYWIHGSGLHHANANGSQRPISEVILRSDSGTLLEAGATRPFSMSSASSETPTAILSQSSGNALAHVTLGTSVGVPMNDREQLPSPGRGLSNVSNSSCSSSAGESSSAESSLESDNSYTSGSGSSDHDATTSAMTTAMSALTSLSLSMPTGDEMATSAAEIALGAASPTERELSASSSDTTMMMTSMMSSSSSELSTESKSVPSPTTVARPPMPTTTTNVRRSLDGNGNGHSLPSPEEHHHHQHQSRQLHSRTIDFGETHLHHDVSIIGSSSGANNGKLMSALSMDAAEPQQQAYPGGRKHANSDAPPLQVVSRSGSNVSTHSNSNSNSNSTLTSPTITTITTPSTHAHRATIFSWDAKTAHQSLQSRLNNAAHLSASLYDPSSISRELCCRVEMRNAFAIYDVSAMDVLCGDPTLDPPAWIDLEAVVIDESNFKTGENYRRLELHILSPKLKQKSNKSSGLRNPFSPYHHATSSSSSGVANNSNVINSGIKKDRDQHGSASSGGSLSSAFSLLTSSASSSPATPSRRKNS
jgi:hypothetical protein